MTRVLTFLLAVAAIMFLGCSEKADTEKMVATAAKQYYDCLLDGRYDEFVAGIDGTDSISGGYREQLRDNAKLFLAQQNEMHKNISSFTISDAEIDADNHTANAFLVVNYGDSTSEQIVVPMVERDGVWKMR